MDVFEWEELAAEMLGVTDEERVDDNCLSDKFHKEFDIEFEIAFKLVRKLLLHTAPLESGLSKTKYHAFVSRGSPTMLMRTKVKDSNQLDN